MPRKFTIKKEIRSLGIDACNPGRVIGAVVRGGLYLDGVVAFSPNPKRWSLSIANAIVRTRFYPELKLIMTHDPEEQLDAQQIERTTRVAVIEVSTTRLIRRKGFELFKVGKRQLQARSSLETRTVKEILDTTWTTGSLPESLRIAHLIAISRFLEKKPPVLG